MNRRYLPLASAVLVALSGVGVPAAAAAPGPKVLYASADGSGPACSPGRPCDLRTVQADVRDRRKHPLHRDIVVSLADGTYRLDAPIQLTTADSGRDGHTVRWQAAPGAHPVLSGAMRVTGWSDYENGVWRASVPVGTTSRQLYVDGLRAVRARHRVTGSNAVTATGFTSTDPVWGQLGSAAGVEVEMVHFWKDQRCPVAGVSGDTVTMAEPCWHNGQIQGTTFDGPTWLSNAYEFLDEAGEFYLDSSGGHLYYMPRPGEDLARADVELPVLESLVTGSGTVDEPVHDIAFRGITFSYGTWLGPDEPDGYALGQAGVRFIGTGDVPSVNGQATDYYVERQLRGQLMPANVSFDYAHDIAFDGDTFTHLGAAGLALGLGAQQNTVTDSAFVDVSGSGVEVGDVTADAHHPSDPRTATSDNTISGSLITQAGAEYLDTVGVFVGYTTHTTIDHNTIYDLPYSGISAGWGWGMTDPEASGGDPRHEGVYQYLPKYDTPTTSSDNQITNNLIEHVMQTLRDGGGIYTLGAQRGTLIAGNYISDVPGGDPSIGGAGANGIYTDEGTRYTMVRDNVVTGAPAWMSAWNPFSIQDNTYTHNYTDIVQGPPGAAAQNTIVDNTTVTDGQWPSAARQIMDAAGAARPFATFALSAGRFTAGGTTTVTATFTNAGDAPESGIALRLFPPAGWPATAGPPATTTVDPGASLAVSYRVSVPAGTQPGSYPIQAQAHYGYDDVGFDLTTSLGADLLYASLGAAFNSICISDESDRTAGNCDGNGYSYPAELLAAVGLTPGATVSYNGLDYTWPDAAPGEPDNVQGAGQQISLSGAASRVGLLLSSKDGSYTFTLHYADGTAVAKTVTLPNWVNKPPTSDTALYARLPYRNTPFGTHDTAFQPGVFVLELPADASRELRSIELPDTGRVNVFALSLSTE